MQAHELCSAGPRLAAKIWTTGCSSKLYLREC